MNADNPYFKVLITDIPVTHLKEIIREEIIKLLFDFGQKVVATEPEFDYLINQTSYALRNHYPKWRLHYLDECFRKGKLDEYDKGQRVTMKRLEYWMKSYNILTMDRVKKEFRDKQYSDDDNDRFASNGRRFPNIIKFRSMRKPDFDGEEWTLLEIEASPAYQKWLNSGGYKSQYQIESKIFTKI